MSLIAIIVLLLFIGVSALVSSSLVGTGNIGGANVVQSAQALSIAHAGKEWYLEQIQGDPDWTTNEATLTNALGAGFFDISVASRILTRIIFTSTGRVVNPEGLTIRRRMSVTAWKLPTAFQFALYQGTDPGVNLSIQNTSTINGDVYSRGSVTVAAGSQVNNGTVYVPAANDPPGDPAETVGGAGTFTAKIMPLPALTMPAITTTAYTTRMGIYDGVIPDVNPPGGNLTINPPSYVVAGTVIADNINTNTVNGTLNITGCGRLVAWQNINLNRTASAVARTLNVNPTCGDIEFLAGDNLNVGHPTDLDISVNMNVGTGVGVLYSQAQGANTNQVLIEGPNTRLHGVRIYARRRITIQSNADVDQVSLLYVNRAATTANNQIDIVGTGITGQTIVNGSIISLGQNVENLRIQTNASVTGLVYSFDTGGTGRLVLNTCTVIGSVVAPLYRSAGINDQIRAATVTYDATVLPDPPPEGFDTFVMKKPDSWDGL